MEMCLINAQTQTQMPSRTKNLEILTYIVISTCSLSEHKNLTFSYRYSLANLKTNLIKANKIYRLFIKINISGANSPSANFDEGKSNCFKCYALTDHEYVRGN